MQEVGKRSQEVQLVYGEEVPEYDEVEDEASDKAEVVSDSADVASDEAEVVSDMAKVVSDKAEVVFNKDKAVAPRKLEGGGGNDTLGWRGRLKRLARWGAG